MAKEEVEEKVAKAIFKKEEAIKAFEKEIANRRAVEVMIRVEAKEEAVGDILKYGMSYMHSTLSMIKKGIVNNLNELSDLNMRVSVNFFYSLVILCQS